MKPTPHHPRQTFIITYTLPRDDIRAQEVNKHTQAEAEAYARHFAELRGWTVRQVLRVRDTEAKQ